MLDTAPLDITVVEEALHPTHGWQDTEEQQRLRDCLAQILIDHDPISTVMISQDMTTLMRDQLMTAMSTIRRRAARIARQSMQPRDMVAATGLTPATISRLLTESKDL